MLNQERTLTGSIVVDCHGSKVGKASDVIFDDNTMRPTWVVVDYGTVRRHSTAVPYDRVYVGTAGELVTESDREAIRQAPRIGGAPISSEEYDELSRYYRGVVS